MIPTTLLEQYDRDGYFLVEEGLVSPDLFARLRAAAPTVKEKARSGQVNLHANYAAASDPWVIDGILTDAFGETSFGEFMTSAPLLEYAHAFLGPELRLGYLGLLTNPATVDFPLGWHRDVLKLAPQDFGADAGLTPLERARNTRKLRWTLALHDEDSLRLVPGSHRRWGTDRENDSMARHLSDDLPDQRHIALAAGQAVFYDERIIHRAYTRHLRERSSLFGTWARYRPDEPKMTPIPEMSWMLNPGIRETFPEALRPYYDRWLEIYDGGARLASPLISHHADSLRASASRTAPPGRPAPR
jgi:hypothetical protein